MEVNAEVASLVVDTNGRAFMVQAKAACLSEKKKKMTETGNDTLAG